MFEKHDREVADAVRRSRRTGLARRLVREVRHELVRRIVSGAALIAGRLPGARLVRRVPGVRAVASFLDELQYILAGQVAGQVAEQVAAPTPRERSSQEPALAERRGAGRDERSFEQRRRNGPPTGAAPSKTHGPRHTGGGKRKGRAPEDGQQALAELPDLPLDDYDELSVSEIEERVSELGADELDRLLAYEIANKHRQRLVQLLELRRERALGRDAA